MRRALAREGAPVDLLQCLERPSIPAAQYLMTQADLVQATGGRDMVKAAYSSGNAGLRRRRRQLDDGHRRDRRRRRGRSNTRLSKTSDFGSGCSADGNLVVEASIYDALRDELVEEGGHLTSPAETEALRAVYWDDDGHRTPTRSRSRHRRSRPGRASRSRPTAGSSSSSRPRSDRTTSFSSEKLGVVLAMFRYSGFDTGVGHGQGDLRGRRQGPLVRHLLVRRRPHRPPGAGRAGEPDHGPPAAVEGERRRLRQRDADDLEPRAAARGAATSRPRTSTSSTT